MVKLIPSYVLTDLGEVNELPSLSLQKSISQSNILSNAMIKKYYERINEFIHIHIYKHYHGLLLLYSNNDN